MNEPRQNAEYPYKSLGTHLRQVREQSRESLAEVSGAVEIDSEQLEQIEAGKKRPSEDILMLLINHFHLMDHEAVQLWESAGYDNEAPNRRQFNDTTDKPPVVVLAMDLRTMYSDGCNIEAGKNGLVMTFTQGNKQVVPVAKVGMSYQQAEDMLAVLRHAVVYGRYQSVPKQLPPGSAN